MYKMSNGKTPVRDFILNLNQYLKNKALFCIKLLREAGKNTVFPYARYLEDGIYELRPQAGNNIARVFYFFFVDNQIVITNGFIKKTQKTPRKEIEKAKSYRKDFLKNNGGNHEK